MRKQHAKRVQDVNFKPLSQEVLAKREDFRVFTHVSCPIVTHGTLKKRARGSQIDILGPSWRAEQRARRFWTPVAQRIPPSARAHTCCALAFGTAIGPWTSMLELQLESQLWLQLLFQQR